MKGKRPGLFNYKIVGVTCNQCKYGCLVDKKNDKYYCIPPEGGKAWLYYGNHSCGKGEKR